MLNISLFYLLGLSIPFLFPAQNNFIKLAISFLFIGTVFLKFKIKNYILLTLFFVFGFWIASNLNVKEQLNNKLFEKINETTGAYIEGTFKGYIYVQEEQAAIWVAIHRIVKENGVSYSGIDKQIMVKMKAEEQQLFFSPYDEVFFVGDILKDKKGNFCVKNVYSIKIKHSLAFFRLMRDLREYISERFARGEEIFGSTGREMLNALMLGDRSGMSYNLKKIFTDTGTSHIFAISGANVAFFYFMFLYLFRRMMFPVNIAKALILIFLIFYAILTGCSASVLRATIMVVFYVLAEFLGRKKDVLHILALAAFFILIFDPLQLKDVGFQLSFIAVLTIIYVLPYIENYLDKFFEKENLIRYAFSLLGMSVAIFITTAPLILFYFGYVNLFSPLANLFILPVVSVFSILGFIYFLFPVVIIGKINFLIINYLIFVLKHVIAWGGIFKYSLSLAWVLVSYGVIILSLRAITKKPFLIK